MKAALEYFEEPDTRTAYEQDIQRIKNICLRIHEEEEYSVHQTDLRDNGCVYLVDPEKDALIYGLAHVLKYLEFKGDIKLNELGDMVKKILSRDLARSEVHYGGGVFKSHLEAVLEEENNE